MQDTVPVRSLQYIRVPPLNSFDAIPLAFSSQSVLIKDFMRWVNLDVPAEYRDASSGSGTPASDIELLISLLITRLQHVWRFSVTNFRLLIEQSSNYCSNVTGGGGEMA